MLPVAPSKLEIKIQNKNTTLTLVNDGEINLLKTPGLTEINFKCLLPMVQYPFAHYRGGFQPPSWFLGEIEKLKVERRSFPFAVIRAPNRIAAQEGLRDSFRELTNRESREAFTRNLQPIELSTSMTVSLEEYTRTTFVKEYCPIFVFAYMRKRW